MGEGIAFSGLPFRGTSCVLQDDGFDYWIGLYQILELTDTL